MQETNDMLLITIPWADLDTPRVAPALLKGIAESHGYSIKTKDFNIEFKYDICKNDNKFYADKQDYFLSVDDSVDPDIEKFYDLVVKEIDKVKFRYLGISVFSAFAHRATFELCKKIRERLPEVKIVLGGRGLPVKPHGSINHYTSEQERKLPFHVILKKHNLYDKIIIGDAEDAIIDLFAGQKSDELTWHVVKNDSLDYPFANFDDYELDKYSGVDGRPQLHVISSKGCVRRCDFCDVAWQFKKFKSKDGKRMAEEIIFLSEKYNVTEFATADSILNGNMKTLRAALEHLAEYNDAREESKKIKWGGNWICRPRGRVTPEFFDLMYRGGCRHLNVGAEHGSDAVLKAMDKKTDVDGLVYEVEQMHRLGIQCGLNNIVGHWSEKYEDWLNHLDMFIKLGPYFANRTITQLMLGLGFAVLADTPVIWNSHINGVESEDDNFSVIWYTRKNNNLTFKTRISRLINIYKFILDHKIPVSHPYESLRAGVNRYEESIVKGNKFVNERINKEKYVECKSVALAKNKKQFDNIMLERILEFYPKTKVKLVLRSHEAKGKPGIKIKTSEHNIEKLLPEGEHIIEFEFKNKNVNNFEISIFNINENDTILDNNNKILQDKRIEFVKFVIDKIDIFEDQEYYFKHTQYFEKDKRLDVAKPGLFLPGDKVIIDYKHVFWSHFLKTRFGNEMNYKLKNDVQMCYSLLEDLQNISNRYDY